MENDSLAELQVALDKYRDLLQTLQQMRRYERCRAGRLFGIKTEDAGRVRNCVVFRVKTWDHANAGLWFLPPEYSYYVTLPEDGTVWVHEDEYDTQFAEKCDALRAAGDCYRQLCEKPVDG